MKKCEKCNNEHDESYGSGRFCSKQCSNSRTWTEEDKQKRSISVKNSEKTKAIIKNRLEQRIYKKCPMCNILFPIQNGTKNKIYCSKQCYNKDHELKYRKKSSGGYRKGSGRCIGGYYKNIYCHSTYELIFLIWNLDHNKNIKRCDKIFEYIYDNKIHKYFPDFEIDNVIYEIKGYEFKNTKYKIDAVKLKGFEIKILYEKDLKYIFEYMKNKYNIVYNNFKYLYEDYIPEEKNCLCCGKSFIIRYKKSKGMFCSRYCSGKGRYLK